MKLLIFRLHKSGKFLDCLGNTRLISLDKFSLFLCVAFSRLTAEINFEKCTTLNLKQNTNLNSTVLAVAFHTLYQSSSCT